MATVFLCPSLSDPTRTTTPVNQFSRRTHLFNHKPFLRSTLTISRFGLGQARLPGPVCAIVDASASPESFLYTKPSYDWLSEFTLYIDTLLEVLKKGLSTVHIPYAYGFAIILLAVFVNAATFPLKKKSVEVKMAMKFVTPLVNAIWRRSLLDPDFSMDEVYRMYEQFEINPSSVLNSLDEVNESLDEVDRLHEQFGINPWPETLRSLTWIAVSIGLYRKLSDVADEGLLTEGFFRIPSLAGPTAIAARQGGSGISWLFPFTDGQPQLGWPDTLAYLVLPVLMGISEYLAYKLRHSEEPKCKCPDCEDTQGLETYTQDSIVYWPVMSGFVSLFVPSGLSLYWVTHNILDGLQEEWLMNKGAKNPLKDYGCCVKSLIKPIQEKPTSYGTRPGDRFRQIKEREAKRKKRGEE